MSLWGQLNAIVRSMPAEASISFPVPWLRNLLEVEGGEGDTTGEMLTLGEVAQRVGRSPGTIRTWCNTGRLQGAFKLNGRDWRVPAEALEKFLQAQQEVGKGVRGPASDSAVDLGSWRQVKTGAGES